MSVKIDAIIYDFDGVVVDSEALHKESFEKALERWNVSVPQDVWCNKYTGTGSRYIMQDLFEKYSINEDVGKWVEIRMELFDRMSRERHVRTIPGFMEFFKSAQDEGLPQMIASGGHRKNIEAILKNIGLYGKIDFIGLEDVKNRKPDPECFILSAKRMGVRPARTIVFEDSPSGLAAAISGGFKAVALLTSTTRGRLAGASMYSQDFKGLKLENMSKGIFGD